MPLKSMPDKNNSPMDSNSDDVVKKLLNKMDAFNKMFDASINEMMKDARFRDFLARNPIDSDNETTSLEPKYRWIKKS